MTNDESRQPDAYLWDPAADPSDEVRVVERRLLSARFDAARRPLILPAPKRRSRVSRAPSLALAASLLFVMGGIGFWSWRSRWPAGGAWPVTIERSVSSATSSLALRPNEPLQLDATASAQAAIARIGTMRLAPGSALTLLETASKRHRVLLTRGAANVRVWAPPGWLAFRTPAGSIIDFGCVFDLSVDPDGTARVHVRTGWVQMENRRGESLIPAGASSMMTAAARPGVPVFDDAPEAFRTGVRALEHAADDAARSAATAVVLRTARPRDVLTLLVLATKSPPSVTRPIIYRAAQLAPPPSAIDVQAVAGGDGQQLWRWYGTLDLPPPKSWWRNWRDALPLFR